MAFMDFDLLGIQNKENLQCFAKGNKRVEDQILK